MVRKILRPRLTPHAWLAPGAFLFASAVSTAPLSTTAAARRAASAIPHDDAASRREP